MNDLDIHCYFYLVVSVQNLNKKGYNLAEHIGIFYA